MNIGKILFKFLPSIVFEPVAVFGLLGLLGAAFLYRKNKSVLYWVILFSLLFMVFWRCAILIISSRYMEIMLIPMIIGGAYFFFELEKRIPLLPFKTGVIGKYLPGALLLILTAVCIGKDLSCNTYTPIQKTASAVLTDPSPGKRLVYTLDLDRLNQVSYYTGSEIPVIRKDVETREFSPEQLMLRMIADAKAKGVKKVYIFASASSREKALSAKDIGLSEGTWELFTQAYYNRKKKKAMRVYRYIFP